MATTNTGGGANTLPPNEDVHFTTTQAQPSEFDVDLPPLQLEAPAQPQPSLARRAAADIGQGLKELPAALATGGLRMVQGAGILGENIGEAVGGALGLPTQAGSTPLTAWAKERADALQPKSVTGGLTAGVVQFLGGFGAVKGVLKMGGYTGAATTAGAAAESVGIGAVADGLLRDPAEHRLSDLVQSVPALANPVTRMLASGKDDSVWASRLKNALEGAGLGAATEGILAGVRSLRAMRAGDLKAAAAEADKAAAAGDKLDPASADKAAVGLSRLKVGDAELGAPREYNGQMVGAADLNMGAAAAGHPANLNTSPIIAANDPAMPSAPLRAGPQESGGTFGLTAANDPAQRIPAQTMGEVVERVQAAPVRATTEANADGASRFMQGGEAEAANRNGAPPAGSVAMADYGGANRFMQNATGEPANANMAVGPMPREQARPGQAAVQDNYPPTPPSQSEGPVAGQGGPRAANANVQATTPAGGVQGVPVAPQTPANGGSLAAEVRKFFRDESGHLDVTHASPGVAKEAPSRHGRVPGEKEAGAGVNPRAAPGVRVRPVSEEFAADFEKAVKADRDAIAKHGSLGAAVEAGYIPPDRSISTERWASIQSNDDVYSTLDALVRVTEKNLDAPIIGGRQSFEQVIGAARSFATSLGINPDHMVTAMTRDAGAVSQLQSRFLAYRQFFSSAATKAHEISRLRVAGELGGYASAVERDLDYVRMLSIASEAGNIITKTKADIARNLNALKITAAHDPEFFLSPLMTFKGAGLADWDKAFTLAGDEAALSVIAKQSYWSKGGNAAMEVFMNGLLSGPTTHIVNATSNMLTAALTPVQTMAGAALRRDWHTMAEGYRHAYYLVDSVSGSFEAARRAWRYKIDVGDPSAAGGKIEMSHAITAEALGMKPGSVGAWLVDWVGEAIRIPGEALSVSDAFYKQITYRSFIKGEAHVEGMERGLRGKELAEYVNYKLGQALGRDGQFLDQQGIWLARKATFQSPLDFHSIGGIMSKAVTAHPALRLIIPFVKTPANILRYTFESSPLGLLSSGLRAELREGGTVAANAMGRMVVGTSIMGSAALLAMNGQITGSAPRHKAQREQWQREGWRPYSIRMGTDENGNARWVNYGRFDPVGSVMAFAADMASAYRGDFRNDDGKFDATETAKWEEMVTAGILATQNIIRDKAYFIGLDRFLRAISTADEKGKNEALQEFVGGIGRGFVPYSGAMKAANDAFMDPYMRDAHGMLDSIKSNLPHFSQSVQLKYDALGEPMAKVPPLVSVDTGDPVQGELSRLSREANIGFAAAVSTKKLGLLTADTAKVVTDGATGATLYSEWMAELRASGVRKALSDLFASPDYQRMEDGRGEPGTRSGVVQQVLANHRQASFASLLGKKPELVERISEQNANRISELYKGLAGQGGSS